MNPSVSVLIAVRNGEATLEEQLRALARQTYVGPLEIIVADNGSTDGTRDVIKKAAEILPVRIVGVTAGARAGAPYATNSAARLARGELFLICDSDDIATDQWVELMVRTLADSPFVGGRLLPFIDQIGVLTEPPRKNVDDWHGYCRTAATASVGLTRDLFDQLGGFDERLLAAADIDLAVRAYELGVTIQPSEGEMWYRQRPSLRAWSANLAWCVSWDIAVQADRKDALRARGGYQSVGYCISEVIKQFIDPRRWPKGATERAHWGSQLVIKWGRVRGHLTRRRRMRTPRWS